MKNKILLLVLLMGIMSFSTTLSAQSYGDELAEQAHFAQCMSDHIDQILGNIDQLSSSTSNCTDQYIARNSTYDDMYVAAVATSVYQAYQGNIITSIITFTTATIGYISANSLSSDAYDSCGKSALSSFDMANRMADAEFDDCIK